jgi:hypothetical protein
MSTSQKKNTCTGRERLSESSRMAFRLNTRPSALGHRGVWLLRTQCMPREWESPPMFASLGLSCEPALVQSVTADRVTLKSDQFYASGLWTIVELVNTARTFKCVLFLRVGRVRRHKDGTCTWDAEFARPLTVDELHELV